MAKARVFGAPDRNVASPMAKVQAISSVYFPEFEEQIRQLDIIADQYEIWITEAGQKRLAKDDTFAEGATEAHQPYYEKFQSLLKELRQFAKREFQ